MKNRLLGRKRGKLNECLGRRGKNKAVFQGPGLFMLGIVRRHINYEKKNQISWLDLHRMVTVSYVLSFWPHHSGEDNHEQFLYTFLGKLH